MTKHEAAAMAAKFAGRTNVRTPAEVDWLRFHVCEAQCQVGDCRETRALEVQAAIAAFEVHGLEGMEPLELVRLAGHDHRGNRLIRELAGRLERALAAQVDAELLAWEHGLHAAA